MTVLARSLDRRSQAIIRDLPESKVQALDRRTQLVFRVIEFVVPPVIPQLPPFRLTPKERTRVMNAVDFTFLLRPTRGLSPEMIVAKLRGAGFRVSNGHYIPRAQRDRDTFQQARKDVAGWLGFSSIGAYKRALAAEEWDIFERRRP